METWLLGQDDLGRILQVIGRDELMRRMIDRLGAELAELGRGGRAETPARSGFTRAGDAPGVIELMPHREAGSSVTVKTISYSPRNPRSFGLPTIVGTISRIDEATGRLVALADGVLLTAVRTGAASAVASRLLAAPESTRLGLIGAGAQAVTQAHALSQVFALDSVLVADVDPAAAAGFAERIDFLGLRVEVAQPRRVLAESDIVCTATSVPVGTGPVVEDGPHPGHLHVNSIGSDEVGKTELPVTLLRRAFVCVDHRGQAEREGESQQLSPDEIGPTLGHLCAHPAEAARHRSGLTVFDSTGFAFEDHVALDVFLAVAEELGLGTKLAIEHHPENALDPYSTRLLRTRS
ncbi:ornithine cyclodeaminase family protein [Actinokineospora iranica]|uniref:Alanine dehydrogenase n=1 Tax=Actinokineospora iranica TaxID=1271860 RepID=A0A1G6U7H5_9PSEU|nr:ornithine cyclodeaminase family protein [Actinokineospora iranica]SDD36515.1 alanine dehydrogenase [Actinokineospora iranica]